MCGYLLKLGVFRIYDLKKSRSKSLQYDLLEFLSMLIPAMIGHGSQRLKRDTATSSLNQNVSDPISLSQLDLLYQLLNKKGQEWLLEHRKDLNQAHTDIIKECLLIYLEILSIEEDEEVF